MNRNNDPNGFFSRPGLPASSRSGSCWACLSTLLLKLNLRFLNQLGRFFSLAFFCRPIFWLKLLDPSGPTLLALLGRLLCSLGLRRPFCLYNFGALWPVGTPALASFSATFLFGWCLHDSARPNHIHYPNGLSPINLLLDSTLYLRLALAPTCRHFCCPHLISQLFSSSSVAR